MYKYLKIPIITLFALLASYSINAVQPESGNDLDTTLIKPVLPISEIIRYDSILNSNPILADKTKADSLLDEWLKGFHETILDSVFNLYTDWTIPETNDRMYLPDSIYISRMQGISSPIPMTYNTHVKKQIILFTTTQRNMVSYALGRSLEYFPMIESELDAANIPLEFKILPVIESTLLPVARSHKGATGMWQFMLTTGRNYGLEITSFIDQRRDPLASTKAACKYLNDMYDIFNDWTLALAAYNCGPGNVNKAIKRAGGKTDFWEIYDYLPRETRNYVPKFIAMTYMFNFYNLHEIEPKEISNPFETDTVMINRIMHLEQVSSTLDIPLDLLQALNPQYKLDIIPANKNKSYSLTLPRKEIANFIVNQNLIMSKDTMFLAQYLRPSKTDDGKKEFSIESVTYVVRKGDTLGGIAAKHHVSVSQIMKWNNIKSSRSIIRPGQRLEIFL